MGISSPVVSPYKHPFSFCTEYLTVTLGSWVTPHTMEAWVPLMTLWSWGGLVMRVRAARQGEDSTVSRDMVSGTIQ